MIRDRIGDEPRKGSLPADTATASVAYEYLAWATVWLLVGTVAGLIPAIKLNWPDFLAISWLSYGRVRPVTRAPCSGAGARWRLSASHSMSYPAPRARRSGARPSPGLPSGSGTWLSPEAL